MSQPRKTVNKQFLVLTLLPSQWQIEVLLERVLVQCPFSHVLNIQANVQLPFVPILYLFTTGLSRILYRLQVQPLYLGAKLFHTRGGIGLHTGISVYCCIVSHYAQRGISDVKRRTILLLSPVLL